jgi:hypothetical protein
MSNLLKLHCDVAENSIRTGDHCPKKKWSV